MINISNITRYYQKSLPLILIVMVALIMPMNNLISLECKRFLYTVSINIKEIMVFVLPFVIFSIISISISEVGAGALAMLFIVFPAVFLSNFINNNIFYNIGTKIFSGTSDMFLVHNNIEKLESFFTVSLPHVVSNKHALIAAMFFGILTILIKNKRCKDNIGRSLAMMSKISMFILNGFFANILPLFVLGFIIKLDHDGVLSGIIKNCKDLFIILMITLAVYFSIALTAVSIIIKKSIKYVITCLIPVVIVALTTMSSLAAMPVIIVSVEKFLKEKNFARIVVPSIVNFHLVGDCILVPFCIAMLLPSFGVPLPSPMEYVEISVYLTLAKFAVAAVPAGGIIVAMPFLEKYLMFSENMLSAIFAIYVIFDPILTATNSTFNSIFATLFSRIPRVRKNLST